MAAKAPATDDEHPLATASCFELALQALVNAFTMLRSDATRAASPAEQSDVSTGKRAAQETADGAPGDETKAVIGAMKALGLHDEKKHT